ncbi:MAG: glycoside hydrolase family 9 protein [Saprospiraceae bacterium]
MNTRIYIIFVFALLTQATFSQQLFVRHNLLGYLPEENKRVIVMSSQSLSEGALIWRRLTDLRAYPADLQPFNGQGWGSWKYYTLDISRLNTAGSYALYKGNTPIDTIHIGPSLYGEAKEASLEFMRQQQCGYNPFIGNYCHTKDGIAFYTDGQDSVAIDARGGWHDAGDQLKYMITATFATAIMLKAYEDFPENWNDGYDELGNPGANDWEDVLDQARWGLDWIIRMHPDPQSLYHQVGDDRDHVGWKWPQDDPADYGWGPNSYRPVYAANGLPQGLGKYKSQATGIANIAGRAAAACAIASRIWWNKDEVVMAALYLDAAAHLYNLGKAKPGYQQGNSYGAPYRYLENTWADDMEWAAAEMYATTRDPSFIEEGKQFARMIGAHCVQRYDTARHYELYPFVNMGHAALFPWVDKKFQDTLSGYYRESLEATMDRAAQSPFGVGHPFIWCSNNVAAALMIQIIEYERMSKDLQFHDLLLRTRDWLLGTNCWGSSMITGVPLDGDFPRDVHTSIYALSKQVVKGGLVDGPVYTSIFNQLAGLALNDRDEYAAFQNPFVVYHDDMGDYSTNEPTMDGTATLIYALAYFATH